MRDTERRLAACRDHLGWTTIPARIVDVPSIIDGEYAENEVRKNFSPEERVAIRKAVQEEIGNRQGERMDKQLVPQGAQVLHGEKTRDLTARLSGFTSHTTADRAQTVVDKGVPELKEAMNKGEIPIRRAAKLAMLPPDEQREAISGPDESLPGFLVVGEVGKRLELIRRLEIGLET